MDFIRKLLSVIIFSISSLFVLLFVSVAVDVSTESSARTFAVIFAIVIGLPLLLLAKWLWSIPIKINQSTFAKNDLQDSVVVKVPTGIQYKLEISSPDPAIESTEDFSSKYDLKYLQSFPGNLFFLENYNSGKFLLAISLFMSSIYFVTGFVGFLYIQNNWSSNQSSGFFSLLLNSIVGNEAIDKISSTVDIVIRFFIFVCNYCLAWIVFDPKNAEGYAMGFFNVLIGIVYMFAPLDAIPDFVPIVGAFDDTFLGAGMVLLGSSSWYRARLRDINTDTVLHLIKEGNSDSAIQLLLKDKGIAVQNKG